MHLFSFVKEIFLTETAYCDRVTDLGTIQKHIRGMFELVAFNGTFVSEPFSTRVSKLQLAQRRLAVV